MDVTLKKLLPDYAMEAFNEMRISQPARDRLHYFDYVLEGNIENSSALLQKLYVDVISKSNLDYGRIPDSQGALIHYTDYKIMTESMDMLNKLFTGIKSDELKLMNDLHDMIITCRKDYELGYKFNIEIIKISYCTAVLTLQELINVCILAYTTIMRKNAGIVFDFKSVKKKDVIVLKGAKSLLKAYNSGQWTKMMNSFKKNPDFLGTSMVAKESIGTAVSGAVNFVKNNPIIGVPITVIGSIIVFLISIRKIVYWFYCGATRVKDYLRTEKEFVDFAISQEKEDGTSSDVITKHQKLSEKLESIADKIEIKILKTNTDTKKEMTKSDQNNFNASDFRSFADNDTIEF